MPRFDHGLLTERQANICLLPVPGIRVEAAGPLSCASGRSQRAPSLYRGTRCKDCGLSQRGGVSRAALL